MKTIILSTAILGIMGASALAVRDAGMPASYGLIPDCKNAVRMGEDDTPPPCAIPCKPVGTDACHIPCVALSSGESRMMRASNKRKCASGGSDCLTVDCEVKQYPNTTCGGGVWDEQIEPREHCGKSTF